MKAGALVLLLCASAWGSRTVHAEPKIWERVRDPGRVRDQVLLNGVERMLGAIDLPEFLAESAAGAVAFSELSNASWHCRPAPSGDSGASEAGAAAEHPVDPRLEYLIGGALLNSQPGREADARCVIENALRDAPDSPLAVEGLYNLAIVAGKLGDRAAEHAAYIRALDVTWDSDVRANLYANLAESDMALGDLKAARREYRLAIALAQRPDAVSSAYFGLAVALDRSGDLPSALSAAKLAVSIQLPPTVFQTKSVLDLPSTFFTPEYEVHYYKALGAMAEALLAKDDAARRDALADAIEEWTSYLLRAEVDHAPWLEQARLHKSSVERKLAKLPTPTQKTPQKAASERDVF